MRNLACLLLLSSLIEQTRGYLLNPNARPAGGRLITTTKHRTGVDTLHNKRVRSSPSTTNFSQYRNEFKSRNALLELRAGATLAIPGFDPLNLFFSQHPFVAAFFVW